MICGIEILVAALAGFGLGRIKNKAKLAAISAEEGKAASSALSEVKKIL